MHWSDRLRDQRIAEKRAEGLSIRAVYFAEDSAQSWPLGHRAEAPDAYGIYDRRPDGRLVLVNTFATMKLAFVEWLALVCARPVNRWRPPVSESEQD